MDSNERKAQQEGWLRTGFTRSHKLLLLVLLGIIAVTPFDSVAATISGSGVGLQPETSAFNGSELWEDKKQVTEPIENWSLVTSEKMGVSSLFKDYYQLQKGSLGEPITAAFPTTQGWVQFFESGALLLPGIRLKDMSIFQLQGVQNAKNSLAWLEEHGVKDEVTSVVRLPLIYALLAAGSLIPIAGGWGTLTYADLRKATAPSQMVPAPGPNQGLSDVYNGEEGIFIAGGIRAGKDVGHYIPRAVWSYINRADVAPQGWKKQFGEPLTGAIPFAIVDGAQTHHLLIQLFFHDVVALDLDKLDESGLPGFWRLKTGVDYLRTVGFPAVAISTQQKVWAQEEATLFTGENLDEALAHVGPNFPLTLLGETTWKGSDLFYHIQWSTPKERKTGWALATHISFDKPGEGAEWASVGVLSQDLIEYLTTFGDKVGVVIYDLTRQRYYTHNAQTPYIAASSIKVPIMLAFLQIMEHRGAELSAYQTDLLATMIERSDNDSASVLYFQGIGGAYGLTSFMQGIGVEGITPDASAWGYSLVTPQSMVELLKLLYEGRILDEQYRAFSLNLMENVVPGHRVGVGDTAPEGARVAMKIGWVPGPNTLWAMSSSGIVITEKETYIISVYTQDQYTLEAGQAIARQVCGMVAPLLV